MFEFDLLPVINNIKNVIDAKSRAAWFPCFKNTAKFIGIIPMIENLVNSGA